MDFDTYQEESKETARGYADTENVRAIAVMRDEHARALFLSNAANGEAGELAEAVKKWVREQDDAYMEDVVKELGDMMWYMAQMASLLDVKLSDIAERNLGKLSDREERGVLFGKGDDR